MMAHEVRIMKGKTFRINLCVCPPYNADFDGDEMNLHVVQSEEARAEARILMRVQEHIRSPRFGGAVIGAIHDHITGMFLLTHGEASYDIDQTVEFFLVLKAKKTYQNLITLKQKADLVGLEDDFLCPIA